YRTYRFDRDWFDAATNDAIPGGTNLTVISLLECPSASGGRLSDRQRAITDYSAVGPILRPNPYVVDLPRSDPTYLGILGNNTRRRIAEIRDGLSNTIMLAECAGRDELWQMGHWMSSSGSGGAWADPDSILVIAGFDSASGTRPGPCAVNCSNSSEIY